MSYQPTQSSKNTRPLLRIEEATYGTPPLNGTWLNVGIATEFSWSKNRDLEELFMVSLLDRYGEYAFGTEYEFTLNYAMVDTKEFRYGAVLPAGAGTIARGQSFLQSKTIDGTEMFRIFKGNITAELSVTYERILIVEQTFNPRSITHWLTNTEKNTEIGSTANIAPAALTEDPYLVTSSGTLDPLTINALPIDIGEFELNIEWQILTWQPQNHIEPKFIAANRRNVNGSLRSTIKDNVIEDLTVNRNAVPMVLQISNTPPAVDDVDWTFGGVRFSNFEAEDVGDSDEFDTYNVEWTATSFTVQDVA
jgi:hypothetical protein